MSEVTPILSFTLTDTMHDRLLAQLEKQDNEKELQDLKDLLTTDDATFIPIEAFKSKRTEKKVAFFSIPSFSILADLVFQCSFSSDATRIESIRQSEGKDIQAIRQGRNTYATTLSCGLLFSSDEAIVAQSGKALWDVLEERENREATQRRLHTSYSVEFLEHAWADAEKKAFEFVSSSHELLPSGLLELRIGQRAREKYQSQIAEVFRTRKRVNIIKDQKQHISFPATIHEWDEHSSFIKLEVDPAEEIPAEELKTLPPRIHITHNASSDIRTQQEALRRLLRRNARLNTLPLDLFLYGENEAFLNSIRPIYKHEIARARPSYYLQEGKLNKDQKKAVTLALATPDFFFLQGPPGTGKTTFIAELCFQVTQQGGTVLISSQANLAVDNALDRLKNHPDIFAVRLGSKIRINEIGLEFHEGGAIQRWLHSLVDDVQVESKQLHAFQTVHNLLHGQWDEISWHYDRYTVWQSTYAQKHLPSRETAIDFDSPDAAAQEERLQRESDLVLSTLQQARSRYEQLQQLQYADKFDFSAAATFYESQKHAWVIQQISQMRSVLASNKKRNNANLPQTNNLPMPKLIENANKLIERWHSSIYADQQGIADETLRQLERTVVQLYLRANRLPLEVSQKTIKAIVDHGNSAIARIQETIRTFGDARYEVTKELQKEYQQALESYRAVVQKKEDLYQDAHAAQDYLAYQKTLKYLRGYWHIIKPYITQFGIFKPSEHDSFISLADMQQIKTEWTTTTKDEEWEGRLLSERITIVDDWYEVLEKPESRFETPEAAQKEFIRRANVFGATCSYCGSTAFFKNIQKLRDGKFDYVIIDEVSKVTVNELLIPCLFGKKVILVGDHKQLPPVSHEDIVANIREAAKTWAFDEQQISMNVEAIKKLFYEAFFTDRFVFLEKNARYYNRTMMLTEQHRMHSDIKDAINQFYEGRLRQGVKNDERELPWLYEHLQQPFWWQPDPHKHLSWIDISTNPNWTHEQRGASKSKNNRDEAKLILRILKEIIAAYRQATSKSPIDPIEVGIISMYRAQMKLIQKLYNEDEQLQKNPDGLTVQIGTVDSFQGRERDIILLSMVLNDRYDDLTGFLKDPRRINVAMSRARRLLLIFGSRHNYIDAPSEAQAIYQRIYDLAGPNAVSLKPDLEFERLRRQPSSFH